MPNEKIHSYLTRKSIESLPEEQSRLWAGVIDELCSEYCMFPDLYYQNPDNIAPYLCFTDGIPFHYLPSEKVEYNNWEVVCDDGGTRLLALPFSENPHHRHCRAAFEFYFHHIAAALGDGRMKDAAKFAGAVGHALQDNSTPPHAVEGMDGSDIMVFNRYVRAPADDPCLTPKEMFSRLAPAPFPNLPEKRTIFGRSVAEAAFILYSHFCSIMAESRFDLLPLLQAGYARDEQTWNRLLSGIFARTVALYADFLATCHALANPAVSGEYAGNLLLSDLRPRLYTRYLSPPYRSLSIVKNASVTPDGKLAPLELELSPGKHERYVHGLGMGAHADFLIEHEIPPGVYACVQGAVGLHSRLGRQGRVKLRWELNDHVVWERDFSVEHMAERFKVDLTKGGILRFHGSSETGLALDPANHIVLAQPQLIHA